MKKLSFVLIIFLLLGCTLNNSYVKEDIEKIYSVPYIEVNKNDENLLYENVKILEERFEDDFSDEALNKYISNQTFFMLNNINEQVEIKDIEINKTADNQFSYSVILTANNQIYTSSGSLRYEDGKIVYFNVGEYPGYEKDYYN